MEEPSSGLSSPDTASSPVRQYLDPGFGFIGNAFFLKGASIDSLAEKWIASLPAEIHGDIERNKR